MNLFEKIFSSFNKAKIKYLVVGGVAVNLHGYVRFTGDLDLIVFLESENLKKIDILMKSLGYSERLPVSVMELSDRKKVQDWFKNKNLQAFTFNPPPHNLLQIDIIIHESLNFKKIYAHKVVKIMGNVRIPVVSIADLITMKKAANREKDIEDLKALLDLKGLI